MELSIRQKLCMRFSLASCAICARSIPGVLYNFLDTSNHEFASFHNVLDNVLRALRSKGVGAESRQTEAFSLDDEELLWMSGILGCGNAKTLLQTVFYLNGKNFCLQGGDEQRQLKFKSV